VNRSIPLVVLAAIRIRAGPTLILVFSSLARLHKRAVNEAKKSAADARLRAHEKKDQMVLELVADEKKLNLGVV